MGLLTELFVATAEEAKACDGSSARRFRSVQLGGVTNLEFETLWAILAGQQWSPQSNSLEQVASTDETWTFRFPRPYLDLLRELSVPAASAAAKSWAATVEPACAP